MLDPTHPLSTVVAELARRWWLGPGVLIDHPAVDPQARESLADQLAHAFHERVAHLALRTVITDFHTFRESLGLPPDPQSQRAIQAYRMHLADPDHRAALLDHHPVLGQLVARIAAEQTSFVREILQAFEDDADILCSAGVLRGTERVTGLELGLGDTHRHGRAVAVVHTHSGHPLVYKPRSLALDCAMRALWAVLDPGLRHSIAGCVPLSVDRGDYGWQDFIAQEPAMTPDACARYFYRFGALIAVAGVWGATDLHHENVVTHGEHPVVIDLETMLQPEIPMPNAVDLHTQRVLASTAIGTQLLPLRDEDSVMDVMLSGLGVPWPQTSDQLLLQVSDADSDAIAVRRQPWSVTQDSNVPLIGGEPQNPLTWYADLRSGLRDALVAIRQHRTELEQRLRALPEHAEIRYGFRATEVYSRYLDALTHPTLLVSDTAADEVLDLLTAPAAAASASSWFVASERQQLRVRDVPLFTARVGDTRVRTDQGPGPEMFVESAVDAAVRRMRTGCELSDDLHELVLETCCGELARGPIPASSADPLGLFGRHLTTATNLADSLYQQLIDIAINRTDSAGRPELGWIGGTGLGVSTLDTGTSISFHDFGGITAFLRRYAYLRGGNAGGPEYAEAAVAAAAGWRRRAREVSPILDELPVSVLAGAASGPLVLGREGLADLLERVPAAWDAAEQPVSLDIAQGLAGLTLLLSSVTDHPGVQPVLGEAVERLNSNMHQPLEHPDHDLVHGRLGLWWALLRAGRALGVAAWERQGVTGLAKLAGELPADLPLGWCNGAAGVALALAEGGEHDALVTRLLERAVGHIPAGPVDLSVCHGAAGIAQVVLTIDGAAGRGPERAQRYFDDALQAPRRAGFVNGAAGYTALPGYLLGWSGVADTALLLEPGDEGAVFDHSCPAAVRLAAPVTLSVDPCPIIQSPTQLDTRVGA